MADGDQTETTEEGGKKKSPLMLIIIIAVVASLAGGGGAYFLLGDKSTDEEVSENGDKKENEVDEEGGEGTAIAEAHYFSLDPPFIVNFTGKSRARFLQVSIEGMTRDSTVKEDITKHIPQVRNNIVLLLSGKTHDELTTVEGKATLRKQVLKEIQKILETETFGRPADLNCTAFWFRKDTFYCSIRSICCASIECWVFR